MAAAATHQLVSVSTPGATSSMPDGWSRALYLISKPFNFADLNK
jgi:hypothetical protein